MHTRGSTDEMGLGEAAKQVTERASSIARLELELASLELKRKAASLGLGIGLTVGAAVVGLFALAVGIATAIIALAIVLDLWLASLIVFVALLVIVAILAFLGIRRIQRGTPPLPEQAIEEARRTTAAIKGNGH
jgi:tetrahydromethanopterin S-methyltransferase subunit C